MINGDLVGNGTAIHVVTFPRRTSVLLQRTALTGGASERRALAPLQRNRAGVLRGQCGLARAHLRGHVAAAARGGPGELR